MAGVSKLQQSVGPGAPNRPVDVAYVQHFVNLALGFTRFKVDGVYSPEVERAIAEFFHSGFETKLIKHVGGKVHFTASPWDAAVIPQRKVTPPPSIAAPVTAPQRGPRPHDPYAQPFDVATLTRSDRAAHPTAASGVLAASVFEGPAPAPRRLADHDLEPPVFSATTYALFVTKLDIERGVRLFIKQFGGTWFDGATKGSTDLFTMLKADPQVRDVRIMAYMLATAKHETMNKMVPNKEVKGGSNTTKAYWTAETVTRGQKTRNNVFCGRGYVHLTWRENYERATTRLQELGVLDAESDMEWDPELALDLKVAYACLATGMLEGWYAGWNSDKGLRKYITGTTCDYVNARKTVNGTDQAQKIAREAERIEKVLRLGSVG